MYLVSPVKMYLKISIYTIFLATVFGKKSFTVLLDTTMSMQDEIDVIRSNIGSVMNAVNSSEISKYILLPYNDPDVGPPHVSSTPDGLISSLSAVTVGGGADCPENFMDGIQKALEVSDVNSYIFVFTDAYAKDDSKFSVIRNLCRETHNQVVIFLSGECVPIKSSQAGNIDVYYDIAQSCSGTVFPSLIGAPKLRQAFKFMKEIVKGDWTNIFTREKFVGYKAFKFSVDSFTKDYLVVVSGTDPTLLITNGDGMSPDIDVVVDTRHTVVFRLINPEPEEYTATVRSRGSTLVTFYSKNEIPFRYGFSTRMVKNFLETSSRPIPGWTNYILMSVQEGLEPYSLEVVFDDSSKQLKLDPVADTKTLYVANTFFEPEKSFRISISGLRKTDNRSYTTSTGLLMPQKAVQDMQWIAPEVEFLIPESQTVDYGQNLTVTCRVTGYPKPVIQWEDETGNSLPSEDILIEMPSVHISYVTLVDVKTNKTIYCKAKNIKGENYVNKDIFVNRTAVFDVIQKPEDETIEYGAEGKLHCEVKAYPDATTKWYHNETLIEFGRFNIVTKDTFLSIKNMSEEDVGEYKCEITNELEKKSFSAYVSISGLEMPKITTEKTEVILKSGDWTNLECSIVKGKPTPKITWKFMPDKRNQFTTIPDALYIEDNKLKIPAARTEHSGLFRCEAVNSQGIDYRDIVVVVQSAPRISDDKPVTLKVKEGDTVVLKCDVEAQPAARVRWEMMQNDVIVSFDDRHRIDDRNTLRFAALWRDSGEYHCIAENDLGRTEKIVEVNVVVAPYIQAPVSKRVSAKVGESLTFACNVLFGNPTPSTKWEFVAPNSTTTVLSRGHSPNSLHLKNISRNHEGSYVCIASNDVGVDTIKIYLTVF